eukprot:360406-Pleurochrysis_carterae.AAC.1
MAHYVNRAKTIVIAEAKIASQLATRDGDLDLHPPETAARFSISSFQMSRRYPAIRALYFDLRLVRGSTG